MFKKSYIVIRFKGTTRIIRHGEIHEFHFKDSKTCFLKSDWKMSVFNCGI